MSSVRAFRFSEGLSLDEVCSIYMQDLGASTLSRSLRREAKVQAFFLHVYVSKSLVGRAWENVGDLGIRRETRTRTRLFSPFDPAVRAALELCVCVVDYACVYAMQVIDTWTHRVVVASWTIGLGVAPRSLLLFYMQRGLLQIGACAVSCMRRCSCVV